MSLTIKFFCFLFVLGFAGLFVLKKPDGTPWLSVNDFIPDTSSISSQASTFVEELKSQDSQTDSSQSTTGGIYRWKDQQGNWVYSDTPPADQSSEVVHVTGDLNKDLTEKVVTTKKAASSQAVNESTTNSMVPASLSPEKISKLMEDTQKVKELLNDRQSQLDNVK